MAPQLSPPALLRAVPASRWTMRHGHGKAYRASNDTALGALHLTDPVSTRHQVLSRQLGVVPPLGCPPSPVRSEEDENHWTQQNPSRRPQTLRATDVRAHSATTPCDGGGGSSKSNQDRLRWEEEAAHSTRARQCDEHHWAYDRKLGHCPHLGSHSDDREEPRDNAGRSSSNDDGWKASSSASRRALRCTSRNYGF